ncbi:unnamed protein product, partial [Candidula unifasciata]
MCGVIKVKDSTLRKIKNKMAACASDVALEDVIFYCDKCQMKYEGACPQHGPPSCVDEAQGPPVDASDQHQDALIQSDSINRRAKDIQADSESKLHCDNFLLKE